MVNPAPITLEQLFRFYRGLPHQSAAISELEADILTAGYSVAMRRDRPWFKTWSTDGKQDDPVALALPLIQSFEGCRLTAYPDPGTGGDPWTIGWGTTSYANGQPVKPGDTITQQKADELLNIRVRNDTLHLRKRIPSWDSLAPHQQAALLSFAYNVGRDFYGADGFNTITARLMDAQYDRVPEAMLLYINPGTKVEAGLRRRRQAEGRLWCGPQHLQVTSEATAKIPPHLKLTRTKKLNPDGLELLRLCRVIDGIAMDELMVVSGVASKQRFETGARSQAGSLTPLPEGRWRIGPIEWKSGKGNWDASWGQGLGPLWIGIEYESPGHTARSAVGMHLDANAATAPGSAGCVVLSSRTDVLKLVSWLEPASIRHLFVDWGLGTCPKPVVK